MHWGYALQVEFGKRVRVKPKAVILYTEDIVPEGYHYGSIDNYLTIRGIDYIVVMMDQSLTIGKRHYHTVSVPCGDVVEVRSRS
jgi:hypothetical protein